MVLTDIFFTLFNFSILVVVCFYSVKKYRPVLAQEIVDEQQHYKQLNAHRVELKHQLQLSIDENTQQFDMCLDLKRKIATWKKKFEAQKKADLEARKALQASLIERHRQQKVLREAQRVEARVVPHALAQARLELYEQFHKEGQGAGYVGRVVKKLQSVKI